jgi:thiol-disulfide isomerase/thioredoxin
LTARTLFAAIGLAALAAGSALWWMKRPPAMTPPALETPARIAPGALFAVGFKDATGRPATLGAFAGRILVVNFWASWCGPCREEMPAFSRLHARWSAKGVQFVGLSDEDPSVAARFGQDLAIAYPLWTGDAAVMELSRRLGNRLGVLPHTVLIGPSGEVLDQQVGAYSESALDEKLKSISRKSG